MESLWQDLRFAARSLVRSPVFMLVAVSILTLGIAATSSIFSVVHAVLLQDIPYRDPDRVVLVETVKDKGGETELWPTSYVDFSEWRDGAEEFESLLLYSPPQSFNLTVDGEPQRVTAELVSTEYFQMLGVAPILGRLFSAEENEIGGLPRVALLSFGFWQRSFGGAPEVVEGQSLLLDGESYSVVGVLPRGFRGLTDEAEVWLPLTLGSELLYPGFFELRGLRMSLAAGRLRPGVSMAVAQEALARIAAGQAAAHPLTNQDVTVRLRSLSQAWFGDYEIQLLTLLGSAGLVLLIACSNIASLLLVRAMARKQEISLRAALGATRARIIRQLLTESALLAILSGVLGLVVAGLTTKTLVKSSGVEFRSFVDIGLDPFVLIAVIAISLLCAMVFGLAPAWMISGGSPSEVLGAGQRGSAGWGSRRFQSAVVIVEFAVALLLLSGTGIMIKSFQELRRTNLGFDVDVAAMRMDVKGSQYADASAMILFSTQVLDRLRQLPGVSSVAVSSPGMPGDAWAAFSFLVQDVPSAPEGELAVLPYHHVSPGYFSALGIALKRGRVFGPQDTEGAPLSLVVSEALEKRYWPASSALEKKIRLGSLTFTIIGVVADVQHQALRRDLEWPAPDIYFSQLQFPSTIVPTLNILARSDAMKVEALLPWLREQVASIAPSLPVYDVATLRQRLSEQIQKDRFLVSLMSLFGGLALVLAVVGLYGITSFMVKQRKREIGIRMAMGAEPRSIVALVLRQGFVLTLVGMAVGLAAAIALNRILGTLVFGIEPGDLLILGGSTLTLAVVALLAMGNPALRAIRVDPVETLRAE